MTGGGGFLKEFGQRIAELLQEEPEATAAVPVASVPAVEATAPDAGVPPAARGPAGPRQMLEHVREALGDRAELAVGRVNFVNLDRIKERLGDRWPRIEDRVDDIVRRAIQRRLEPHDLYTPLAGHRYLISFGRLSPADAALKTAMIGDEISRLLTGEDLGGETLEVRTAVAALDGSLEFREIPSVQSMVEHMYEVAVPAAEAPPTVSRRPPLLPPADEDPLARVQLVYRPAWDVRRNVVSTFFYVPAVQRGGNLALGRSVIRGIDDPKVIIALDLMILNAALEDLVRLAESGRKLLLAVTLHFESVATTSRLAEYVKLCRMVPPDLQQLLIFELVEVPVGVPQSRLLELTTILRRYSRSILLQLPLIDPVFRPGSETGINIVGASLTGMRLRERQVMRAFDRFCEGAQKVGLQSYIHGLRTLSLTTAAVSAGFDYVDGDVVKSVVDEPDGIYRFDARTMIRNWTREAKTT